MRISDWSSDVCSSDLADLDKASEENERQHFVVERADGVRIGFTQIAGLVARRIMPFVTMGNELTTGQRVGLIRFGSRVDVSLAAGTPPQRQDERRVRKAGATRCRPRWSPAL